MNERPDLLTMLAATNPQLAARFETTLSELRACIAAESETDLEAAKANMLAGYARLEENHPELAERFRAEIEGHLANIAEHDRKIEIAALRITLADLKEEDPVTAARLEAEYADVLAQLPPDWITDGNPGADTQEQAPRPQQTVVQVAEGRYEVRNEPAAGGSDEEESGLPTRRQAVFAIAFFGACALVSWVSDDGVSPWPNAYRIGSSLFFLAGFAAVVLNWKRMR